MASSPADLAQLIDQLRESKWFRRIDASIWGDLTLRLGHVRLAPGEALFHQDDAGDGIYVVLAGRLTAYNVEDDGTEVPLGEMAAGTTVGEIQVLTGGTRTATVRAAEASELAKIPTSVFDELLRRSPETRREVVAVNERRLHRSLLAEALTRLLGTLDEELMRELLAIGQRREVRRGETLIARGKPGERCFLLLRGRLAAVVEDDEGREMLLNEISRGELVGEMEMVTDELPRATVRATRDSRVVEIPRAGFEQLISRYPQIMMAVARILIQRLSKVTTTARHAGTHGQARRIATVAVVPLGDDVPAAEITARIATALRAFGSTLHVHRRLLKETLGFKATALDDPDDPATLRLAAWLDEQEQQRRFVVYQADPTRSAWTRKCTRQADLILFAAQAGKAPDGIALEQTQDERPEMKLRKVLLLLHPDGSRRPRDTGGWLDHLGLDRHLHLRLDRPGDVDRLARLIAGRAVGVALGGGGARAFAHIGVLRALKEAGIEIDGIGGTSQGSLIAAQHAMGWDWRTMIERNRRIFLEGKPHRGFTLPLVSVLSRRPRTLLEEIFADLEIEDLWLSYFAVSASLTNARQKIHQRGAVSDAVFASMAVPGVAAPAVSHGELLVDGGILNNLPGDVVRRLWGGRVVTVDVSIETERRFTSEAPELPSAGAILKSRLNPFADKLEVPGIFEILVRSSLLASAQNTAAAKAEADLFLRPPVGEFGMFEVRAIDRLAEIGYRYTRERLEDWSG